MKKSETGFIKPVIILPVVLLIIGDVLHIVNLFKMYYGYLPVTIWNLWVNISMLIIDTGLLVGLLKKSKLAYYATMVMFSLFSITQIISLVVIKNIAVQNVIMIITASAVCLVTAFAMLLVRNDSVTSGRR